MAYTADPRQRVGNFNSSNSLSLVSRSMMGVFMSKSCRQDEFVLGSNCELPRISCGWIFCIALVASDAIDQKLRGFNGFDPVLAIECPID